MEALAPWLQGLPAPGAETRWLLSLGDAPSLATALPARAAVWLLSGPEGGLTAAEEALALRHGFARVSLGRRVLRADTAPLAALAALALHAA